MAEFDARLIQIGDLGDQLRSKQLDTDKLAGNIGNLFQSFENKREAQAEKEKKDKIGELYKQNYNAETGRFDTKKIGAGMLEIDPHVAKKQTEEDLNKDLSYQSNVSDVNTKEVQNNMAMARNFAEQAGTVRDQAGWDNIRAQADKFGLGYLLPEQYSPQSAQQAVQLALGFEKTYALQNQQMTNMVAQQNANTGTQNANTARMGLSIDQQRLAQQQEEHQYKMLSNAEKAKADKLKQEQDAREKSAKAELDNTETNLKVAKETREYYDPLISTINNTDKQIQSLQGQKVMFNNGLKESGFVQTDKSGNLLKEKYGEPQEITNYDGTKTIVQPEKYVLTGSPDSVINFIASKIPLTAANQTNEMLANTMKSTLGFTIQDLVNGGASMHGLTDAEGAALSTLFTAGQAGNLHSLNRETLAASLAAYDKALSNAQKRAILSADNEMRKGLSMGDINSAGVKYFKKSINPGALNGYEKRESERNGKQVNNTDWTNEISLKYGENAARAARDAIAKNPNLTQQQIQAVIEKRYKK